MIETEEAASGARLFTHIIVVRPDVALVSPLPRIERIFVGLQKPIVWMPGARCGLPGFGSEDWLGVGSALTMRAFLWVDASCGLVLYALLVLWHGLLQKHTWMFMVSLFYANMLYSFTFAIYWLLVGPVWYIVTAGGSGAHRSCTLATGYDRSGFIGPMLDPRQRQQLREGLDGNEEGISHLDAVQTLAQSFAGLLVSQPSLWYELVLLLHGKVSSAVDDMKRALEVSTQAARDAAAGVIGVFVRKKQKAKGRSEGPSYSHRSTDDALSSRREGEIRAR